MLNMRQIYAIQGKQRERFSADGEVESCANDIDVLLSSLFELTKALESKDELLAVANADKATLQSDIVGLNGSNAQLQIENNRLTNQNADLLDRCKRLEEDWVKQKLSNKSLEMAVAKMYRIMLLMADYLNEALRHIFKPEMYKKPTWKPMEAVLTEVDNIEVRVEDANPYIVADKPF
jgi:chromosome segregation ATPase